MKHKYYVVFSYKHPEEGLTLGCREVELDAEIAAPGERLKLATSLAVTFPSTVIVNWKKID